MAYKDTSCLGMGKGAQSLSYGQEACAFWAYHALLLNPRNQTECGSGVAPWFPDLGSE